MQTDYILLFIKKISIFDFIKFSNFISGSWDVSQCQDVILGECQDVALLQQDGQWQTIKLFHRHRSSQLLKYYPYLIVHLLNSADHSTIWIPPKNEEKKIKVTVTSNLEGNIFWHNHIDLWYVYATKLC